MRATHGIVFSSNKNKKLCPLSLFRLVVEAPKNRVHGGSSYRTQNLRHLWKDTKKNASALPALFSMPLNVLASNIQFPFMPSYPYRHSSNHHLCSTCSPFLSAHKESDSGSSWRLDVIASQDKHLQSSHRGPIIVQWQGWLGHSKHPHPVCGPLSSTLTLE